MKHCEKGRIARWNSTLDEFEARIIYRKGSDNQVADYLSRSANSDVISDVVEELSHPYIALPAVTMDPVELPTGTRIHRYSSLDLERIREVSKKDREAAELTEKNILDRRQGCYWEGRRCFVPYDLRQVTLNPEGLGATWIDDLRLYVQAYNYTYHETLGASPAEVLFAKPVEEPSITIELLEDLRERKERGALIRQRAADHARQVQDELDSKLKHVHVEPKIGMMACARLPTDAKLDTPYTEPVPIVSVDAERSMVTLSYQGKEIHRSFKQIHILPAVDVNAIVREESHREGMTDEEPAQITDSQWTAL
ncbi:hypothetical protein GNI_154300 [Gregarina niphandrodes]|uniref:Uncharacterized protein n=1 Tax=Gregarina niphandrodes TaxID=110365 RepID=A0A023B083_GRENI|nr:hypothetical protein GNI_154300 [Gregarina niphandrodes]EZG44005.1 hypothetical protein GNI_154300 [Gregarina niphandrodes]|eukprot:XP_011132850.1 hypothetical protein GNI_154300 [Gregarina niphandrodes]